MQPTAPLPMDTLARARVYFNLTGQTILVLIVSSRITSSILDQDLSWGRVNGLLITLLLSVMLLGAYFAALNGHQPSMDLLRATWRTEKGSRRFSLLLLIAAGAGLIRWIAPDLLSMYLALLLPAGILLWWRSRQSRGN